MSEKTHHVSEKKKQIASDIQRLIMEYPIIAAVDMENLPTPQLQQMRAQLRGKIELAMTKRRVMKHAINEIKDKKENVEQLIPHLKGMPALIFTKENPFSLFKTLKKSRTSAPAKPGQIAPFDIKIPKGPTSFAPGPIIGELAQLGIKSGVEGGKLVIKEDSIVVKEGQKISAKTAEILTRLGVEPMEVGLNIMAVYEDGSVFKKEVLDINEEQFKVNLQKAASWSFNLAINIAYPTKETIRVLISKAFNDAKALGLSREIIDEGIFEELLSKAERSASSLKSIANIKIVEKPKEELKESKEEIKIEEKPKEVGVGIREEPTQIEKKEEEILEEEKEIIKEEEELEREAIKPKVEAPVEKEIEKEIKEEEEKQLEKERIEKEEKFERIEEEKKVEEVKAEERKKEILDETDRKIAEMVAKTKKFARGEIPSAEKLVEEVSKSAAKEIKKEDVEEKKEKQEIEKLAQELVRRGTLRK